jgi:hypothetical protein
MKSELYWAIPTKQYKKDYSLCCFSKCTLWRNLKDKLLYLYHMQQVQELQPVDLPKHQEWNCEVQ